MTSSAERPGADCLSPLALDAWIAGDDGAATHAARTEHVAGCAACGERAARARELAAKFLHSAPSFSALATDVHARRVQSKRVVRLRVGSLAASALAAAAVAMLMLGPHPEPPGPITRSKGAPQLGVVIKRGGALVRGRSGDVVRPGDALRFDHSSERAGYLALWGDDGRALSLYHPAGGTRAAPIAAGPRVALDFAVELDGALGREHFYGVFCDAATELEAMRTALGRAVPEVPAGCTLDTIVLRKEAAP